MSFVDEVPPRPLTWGEARQLSARLYQRIDVLEVEVIENAERHDVVALLVRGPFDDDGVVFDEATDEWKAVDQVLGEYRELLDEDRELLVEKVGRSR